MSTASLAGLTHLQIDPTSQCDLTCIYCVGRHWKQSKADLGTVERLCRDCGELDYVHLQGEGEPFVHRDFLTMVERVRATGADVGFITNGRHLTENTVRRLIGLGVRSVGISVDSLDPEVYRRLRHGELGPVLEGLRRLLDARADARSPDVYLTAVLTRSTFDDFEEIIAFSQREGLSPPSAQPLQGMPTYVEHYPSELDGELLTDEQHRKLQEYWRGRDETRRRLGLRTYFEDLFAGPDDSRCAFLERSLHVRFDGHVFPCCFMKDDRHSLGHLGQDDLKTVWNGERRRAMRHELAAGRVPEPCEGCPVLSRPDSTADG
ncbi:MAG TPA: radical SAM protein [Candidatus Limnocylindrales bacterium]|nr:radical SAM protein [Candidatus Limnocylindrales bacterium]